jgi:hypothetical protein
VVSSGIVRYMLKKGENPKHSYPERKNPFTFKLEKIE